MRTAKVDILLGVFNGAEYIEATLESVRNQDFQDWCLWVRDDGSTDGTLEILRRWQDSLGERMRVLPNPERRNLGLFANFSALLAACTAPYVTHISHDDIYHPDKLSVTLNAMLCQEQKSGPDRPILVYSDQTVIDGKSRQIAASMWRLTGWKPPTSGAFSRLLVHSAIYGGTTLINRPLINLLGMPPRCEDTWFGWVAAVFGDLVPLPVATVDFRRHGHNHSELISLRATVSRVLSAPWRASAILHERLEALRPALRFFLEHYRDVLPPEAMAATEAFLGLPRMGPLARRRAILKHGLLYSSWLRNLGLLILI